RQLGRRVRVEERVVPRDAQSVGQAAGDDVDVNVRVLVRVSEHLETGIRKALRHSRFEYALVQSARGCLRTQILHDDPKLGQALELRVWLLVERLSLKAINGPRHDPLAGVGGVHGWKSSS